MRPGDLVRGRAPNGLLNNGDYKFRPVIGILIEKLPPHPQMRNVWWRVLCDDGVIVEEAEMYMEVVS